MFRVFPAKECWKHQETNAVQGPTCPHLQSSPPTCTTTPRPRSQRQRLSKCPSVSLRPDLGSEDWDGQERRAAVVHEDVHGLPEVLHLQDEVCLGSSGLGCGWMASSQLPLRFPMGSAKITPSLWRRCPLTAAHEPADSLVHLGRTSPFFLTFHLVSPPTIFYPFRGWLPLSSLPQHSTCLSGPFQLQPLPVPYFSVDFM